MTDVKIDVEDDAVAAVKQDGLVDGGLVDQLIGRAREQGVALAGRPACWAS
jgi:putative transposase